MLAIKEKLALGDVNSYSAYFIASIAIKMTAGDSKIYTEEVVASLTYLFLLIFKS